MRALWEKSKACKGRGYDREEVGKGFLIRGLACEIRHVIALHGYLMIPLLILYASTWWIAHVLRNDEA